MEFEQLIDTAEEWCSGNPFELIAAECSDERRLDFYAEPRFSFYVLCPDANCDTDSFHVWSENEDCLPFLQRAQDYISACGRKSFVQVLDEVFSSFRPLLDLPDTDDTETFEQYHTNVEEEPETDHQQLAVSQQ
ncbi:maturin-like isoform X2 [Paramormyrops kingsleyae]|uniref:maturin-like isoform X2 n=1 Tax=Paramormyrops kingsleyae TaxID=1676925 RepID=UPI000CD5D759|nr:maturin-like isoform X2 [Paramormyrops kingsleyae]